MAFVSAKCTQCGGVLEIDNSKDAAICKYCGMPFVVEKAINYFTQNISVENATINITGVKIDNYIQLIKDSLMTGNIKDAEEQLKNALPLEPKDESLLMYKSIIQYKKLAQRYFIDIEELKKNLGGSLSISEKSLAAKTTLEKYYNTPIDCEEERIALKTFFLTCESICFSDKQLTDYFFNSALDFYNRLILQNDFLSSVLNRLRVGATNLPDSKYNSIFLGLYSILKSPYITADVIDKELEFIVKRDHNAGHHRFILKKIKNPNELNELQIIYCKNKKGKEVPAKVLGQYLLYYFDKRTPKLDTDTTRFLASYITKYA